MGVITSMSGSMSVSVCVSIGECVHRVQFLAYGDVTAVGFGPGILPWPELLEEPEDGVARLSFKHWNSEPVPRCGDGHGNIGELGIS